MSALLKLYVKTSCPWCLKAQQYLDQHHYAYEKIDVLRDPEAHREMIRLSGQPLTPTLVADGSVLADFGPEELEEFLASREFPGSQEQNEDDKGK